MGTLLLLLGAGLIAITLSAPLTVFTTIENDKHVINVPAATAAPDFVGPKLNGPETLPKRVPQISNYGNALKLLKPPPEGVFDIDEDNLLNIEDLSINDHKDEQHLQAYIARRYGFQIFKDCKQYNVTWKCIVDCKMAGYLTVRMDNKCKCLCYHPMPTTSTTTEALPTTQSTTTTPATTNFWEGLKMPTFVGPIWATTPKPNALDTSSTISTTKEPCVDVVTTTAGSDVQPPAQVPPAAAPGNPPPPVPPPAGG